MSIKRAIDELKRGKLSRRDFPRAAAPLRLASMALPMMNKSAEASDFTVFTWSGCELPEFFEPYIEKYNSEPNSSFFVDNDEAFQKIHAG